jgi:crotonobetainyl-CoA:carnitine CoA-transferase CaiB-like acyl-CoA transferase
MELTNEPSFYERAILQTIHHGDWKMATTTRPVRFDAAPTPVKPAPLLGEHTAEALGGWLELSAAEVETLHKDAVV